MESQNPERSVWDTPAAKGYPGGRRRTPDGPWVFGKFTSLSQAPAPPEKAAARPLEPAGQIAGLDGHWFNSIQAQGTGFSPALGFGWGWGGTNLKQT